MSIFPLIDINRWIKPEHRPQVEGAARVALAVLAVYYKPYPTLIGCALGALVSLEGEEESGESACGSHTFVGFNLNVITLSTISAAYLIAHLDRRLCCGTVHAAVAGAMLGIWMRQPAKENLCESSPSS